MKRCLSLILCLLLLCSLAAPALGAGNPPQITLQPQNYHYPEYSYAVYTVKATGTNLRAYWYLEFDGKTYNLSDNTNGIEPWEAYAGETYGVLESGPSTFSWFFSGIEEELSGAQIWCVIEDGHYDVTSDRAIITIQGDQDPPEILSIPASYTVNQGDMAEIRCVARSANGAQLAFQWYETFSGKLFDIRAMDGEDSDFLICGTKEAGTRYYVCCVTDTAGGMVYSSVVPVTVKAGQTVEPPEIKTKTLSQATAGSAYSFQLESSGRDTSYSVSYNPGKSNDFEKTGLKLSSTGLISGTPAKAGSYTFTICASNAGGEDYREYTLKVAEAAVIPTTEPETVPATTGETVSVTEPETTANTVPATTEPQETIPEKEDEPSGFPWWGYLLIALGGIGIGAGAVAIVAIIIVVLKKILKKKN